MSLFTIPGPVQRPMSTESIEQVPLSNITTTLTSPAAASESGYSNIPGTPDTEADGSVPGSGERGKPKQKRNKPTLSCEECVERKTKVCRCTRDAICNKLNILQCDRGRPGCLACMKRQSECRYTQVANLIATVK